MIPRSEETPGVESAAPPVARSLERHRWTIGRAVTDLAIVAIAVPTALQALSPPILGECGTTLDNFARMAGLGFLAAKFTRICSKALDDAAERWLAGFPGTSTKPQPLDDL